MKAKVPEPIFYSVPQVAKICGVSRNAVYSWVRQGKLGAYQTPGRTNLVRPSDLIKFMQDNGMFVPPTLKEDMQRDEKMNFAVSADYATAATGPAVLVVDDDQLSRKVAVRAIDKATQVFQAENGYEALHLLTLHKEIDVVLLDLRMPGKNGVDTIHEIRQQFPHLTIMVITGYPGDLPVELMRKGALRVVQKPYEPQELQDLVLEVRAENASRAQPVTS